MIGTLTEVVVTAQKRSQSILSVPISITAFNQSNLTLRGINSLNDIARSTPGLILTPGGGLGYQNIAIRGILSGTGAATTGMYVDDVPIQQRDDSLGPPLVPELFDLERVEVLRGPQGTLFGAGSEGGAIRFITPTPSLTREELRTRTEVAFTQGGAPTYEVAAAGGAPLIAGTLGVRASVFYRSQGGYIDQVSRYTGQLLDPNANSDTTRAVRIAFRWRPINGLTVTPAVMYQHAHLANLNTYWEERPQFQTEAKILSPDDDRWNLSSLTIDGTLRWFSIRSVSSYMTRTNWQIDDWSYTEPAQLAGVAGAPPGSDIIDVPGVPGFTAAIDANIYENAFTQELRFTSMDTSNSRWSWVGGIYFQHNRMHRVRNEHEDLDAMTEALFGIPAIAFFGSPVLPGSVTYQENVAFTEQDLAAFGSVSLKLTERLKLTLGARVSRTDFQSSDFQGGPWEDGGSLAEGTQKNTPVTPRADITYNLTPDNMVYAAVAKGYRIGGGNPSYAENFVCQIDLKGGNAPPVYKSDSVKSYEIGTKNQFANGRANISVSAFRINWDNIQTLIVMPTCGSFYTDNLGTAVSQGGDVDLNAELAPGLRLSLSAGYDDAHHTETIKNVYGGGLMVADGEKLSIPAVSGSAELYYEHELSSGRDAYVDLSYDFASAYDTGPLNSAVSGYDPTANLAAAVKTVSMRAGTRIKGFDVSVFVDNLTNAAPELTRFHDTVASPVYEGDTLRPRTIGLTLDYRL